MTSKQISLAVMVLTVCLAAWHLLGGHDPEQQNSDSDIGNLTFPIQAPSADQTGIQAVPEPDTLAGSTERVANPLERSADLRAAFEQYKSSKNTLERNIALRAWTACFPTFTAPQGQTVTLDGITRGLSPQALNYAERIDAYRGLLGRCKNFLDLPHDAIVSQSEQLQNTWNAGEARSPGERALQYFNAGKIGEAKSAARAIIASKDAYGISSLSELIPYFGTQAAGGVPPELRSMAFSVAACELGLECGPTSLTALLLCANNGACEGSVVDRYLSELPGQADRDAVLQESQRVIKAIRTDDMPALGL
ncbi:MAG: hypothetical protein NVS3B11_01320 [Collimonas sp.]